MSDWNQFKGDAHHSGTRLDREGPRRIERSWTADFVGPVGEPVCDHETVFVGTAQGNLYAIDATTGSRRWVVETTAATDRAPIVSREMVHFGTDAGKLYAVDRTSGDRYWTLTLPGPLTASPTQFEDRLYVGYEGGLAVCVAETGEVIWSYDTDGSVVGCPAVTDDREWSGPRVYAGTDEEAVFCLEAGDGEEVWRVPTDGVLAGGPTVAEGRVYVADDAGTLLSLDTDTGQSWFTYKTDGGFSSSVTVRSGENLAVDEVTTAEEVTEGTTFIGANDGYVHVTDTTFGRRKVRGWLFSKKGVALDGEIHASPVVVGNVVCLADTTGSVYGIDATRYDHWWYEQLEDAVTNTPAVGQRRLFVPCEDDRLYCLEWDPDEQPGL